MPIWWSNRLPIRANALLSCRIRTRTVQKYFSRKIPTLTLPPIAQMSTCRRICDMAWEIFYTVEILRGKDTIQVRWQTAKWLTQNQLITCRKQVRTNVYRASESYKTSSVKLKIEICLFFYVPGGRKLHKSKFPNNYAKSKIVR